ncbi:MULTISPECIES: hypothetical protein [unclassified Pseudomonas]|uniref:hypothetical protein n=1 Tax=unclassified Pseudomonas TaxID=196821 RepID=UPI00103284AA|nr:MULTISPECIES: hypothetical protein [unclassified Pseudomonas]
MKKFLLAPFALLMHSALAATTTGLSVTGIIDPPSCDVSMVGSDFSYGTSILLNPTGNTALGVSAPQTLNITCAGLVLVGIRGTDNRAGTNVTSINPNAYGLGLDGGNNKIGDYTLNYSNVSLNGGTGFMVWSTDGGTTWAGGNGGGTINTYAAQAITYGLKATSGAGQPVPMTSASFNLAVTPTIAPKSTLDASNTIQLDGSATIALVYL